MKKERTIEFLEKQLALSIERERNLLEQVKQLSHQLTLLSEQNAQFSEKIIQLSGQIVQFTHQIEELTKTIESLQEALLQKNKDVTSLKGTNRGLSKLLSNKSEKITPEVSADTPVKEEKKKPPSPKERGNNGAKRKEHFDLEEEIIDIWPDNSEYDKERASAFTSVDSIRYAYYPPRFVKRIFRLHKYVMAGKIYEAHAPRTPLFKSNYEASFIAGLCQFRYMYFMPVERIITLFKDSGFKLKKPTAHTLIGKTSVMIDRFEGVLRLAIHTDVYIRLDETYHQIINEGKNKKGKATRKGYIWSAMADTLKLVHFFYEEGSREKEVFENYLDKSYQGAVHTDGLACYKAIETDAYPNAIRISCIQHAKRKFLDLDIEKDEQAREIVDYINKLYRIEHEMLPEWDNAKKLEYRNKEATPVLDTLKDKLLLIQKDPATIPSTPPAIATNYMLNEFDAIKNYLLDITYTLDNNPIERSNRSISLNRRNSMFFGSHNGAKRSALLFSLACSCRLHHINAFEYFTDILTRMSYMKPKQLTYEVLRELLPDRWKKADPQIYSDA
jgi:hypothetical protein